MILNRIEVSKVAYYYFSTDKIFELTNVLEEPDSIIFDNDNIVLTISKHIADIVFDIMKLILDKSQKTTIGNSYVYEYELGIPHNSEDTLFTIETFYSSYRVELINLYYNNNRELEIIFKQNK